MKAHAVIGAWWGDEGKGLMTDYLAAQYESPLVVRFNGGSQAGHTVVTPDGMRHVFHHFGSGTLVGAPTYLSEFFIVNPYIFIREYEELAKLGITPTVAIDLNAPVTTPYDMAFNQEIEKLRGDNRHGSVGLGIRCTIERTKKIPFPWIYALRGIDVLPEIRAYYLELAEQGWDMDLKNHPAFYDSTEEIYWDTVAFMRDAVHSSLPEPGYDHIVFEGAQGLILDPEYGKMPYCTPSSCGFRNVRYLADKMGIERVNAVYVSRTYATRHGNGPLYGEPIEPQEDDTNVDHEYQGSLRFSRLPSANHKVLKDFVKYMRCRDSFSMAVTHLDQYDDGSWKFFEDSVKYKSYGPTRKDVVAV